jgi:uncharacterized protein (TIGR04141 family)
MHAMAVENTNITVFLLKESQVAAYEEKLLEENKINQFQLANDLDGTFLPFPTAAREPTWMKAVRGILVSPNSLDLRSQSPAGLLMIKRNGKTYVITFGHAWMKLKDEWLEPDFGRRVALNVIPRDQLIEIGAEQVFAKWHVARERAPKAASVEEFAIESDRDLVAMVQGSSSDPAFGKIVRGSTSLRMHVPIADLPMILDKCTSHFNSSAYKKHWPEIDNLRPIKDQMIIGRLETQLDTDLISSHTANRIIMFTPFQKHGEPITAESYVLGHLTKSSPQSPYITYGGWQAWLKKKNLTPSVIQAKKTPMHFLDEAGTSLGYSSVFNCFGYETAMNGQQYVLSSGIWYEVVPAFSARIDSIVNKIPTVKINLPIWNQIDTETDYNRKCANGKSSLLHFDAKTIAFGGGQSKFEFCDFMDSNSKILFFAKIASRSSGMSHLVEQVRRTTELLFSADPLYRQKLSAAFKKHHPKADASWLNSRPKPGEWNLCFVSLGRKKQHLPFFAKCSLARVYEDLRERGHDVSFVTV